MEVSSPTTPASVAPTHYNSIPLQQPRETAKNAMISGRALWLSLSLRRRRRRRRRRYGGGCGCGRSSSSGLDPTLKMIDSLDSSNCDFFWSTTFWLRRVVYGRPKYSGNVSPIAYYPGPTGEFTGPSVGHNYLRKNGMNLPIDALNRSPRDLSIGI